MIKVKFHDTVQDDLLKFAVIIAVYNGKFVYCKHQARETLEVAGGHREEGETIEDTARRELYEETGAIKFHLYPVNVYSVIEEDNFSRKETFGKLYFANILELESELHSEIENIVLSDSLSEQWTYPEIQPYLMGQAKRKGFFQF